jgi:hypothetical protein
MGCPWSDFTAAKLRFCEAPVCGWVTEPENTWSNVGFFIVGAIVLSDARRTGRQIAGSLGLIAITATDP